MAFYTLSGRKVLGVGCPATYLIGKLAITFSDYGEVGTLGAEFTTPSEIWLDSPFEKAPTAAIIDSQSVRTASQPGVCGYDAGKNITGRKRHILVDTPGIILALKVTTSGRAGPRWCEVVTQRFHHGIRVARNHLGGGWLRGKTH